MSVVVGVDVKGVYRGSSSIEAEGWLRARLGYQQVQQEIGSGDVAWSVCTGGRQR